MTDSCHWDESFDGVEAMVRAAGQYVRASDDLRPRVLEAARQQCGEKRAQNCLRQVAMFVVLVAGFTAIHRDAIDVRPQINGMLAAAGFDQLTSPATPAAVRSGDGDWRIIDAFTKLRRQQAQLLRFEI